MGANTVDRIDVAFQAVGFVALLALAIWLLKRGGGWVWLGWSALAAWAYVAFVSPIGALIWSYLGSGSQRLVAWLQTIPRGGRVA